MKMRIAIPTNSPGGLDADRSDHFGHCDIFAMVDIDEKMQIKYQVCKGWGNCHH